MKESESLVTRILCKNVSGFLVKGAKGYILVDTGHRGTVNVLLKELERLHIDPSEILLILLTHTHYDHAGGAKKFQELIGAPIAVHETELAYLQKGSTPIPKGTRWKGKFMSFLARYLIPFLGNYPPVDAEVIISDSLSLEPYGIAGRVIHTPGHTLGSVTLVLDNGEAIVGDNVLGIGQKECYPPFANLRGEVLESWQKIADAGARVLYPAHGRVVKIEELMAQLPKAKERYGDEPREG